MNIFPRGPRHGEGGREEEGQVESQEGAQGWRNAMT